MHFVLPWFGLFDAAAGRPLGQRDGHVVPRGAIVSCSELNFLEREFLGLINYQLAISPAEYVAMYAVLCNPVVHSFGCGPECGSRAVHYPGLSKVVQPQPRACLCGMKRARVLIVHNRALLIFSG